MLGKNKFFFLILIIFIIAGLILIIFILKSGKGAEKLYSSCLEDCGGEANEICNLNCKDSLNYGLAIENKKISYCEEINYQAKKEYCLNMIYMYGAIKTKDESFCRKITQKSEKNDCFLYLRPMRLPEIWNVGEEEKIGLALEKNGKIRNFKVYDLNNDGVLDTLEHILPDLKDIISEIEIMDAIHLNENKESLRKIYSEVSSLDNIWSEIINENEYIRAKFKQKLDNSKDITLYLRIVSGDPIIEVYSDENKVIEFVNLTEGKNTAYLINMNSMQDTFDLRVVGGSVEFDWIVDPIPGCDPENNDCSNSCDDVFSINVNNLRDNLQNLPWEYKFFNPPPFDSCESRPLVGSPPLHTFIITGPGSPVGSLYDRGYYNRITQIVCNPQGICVVYSYTYDCPGYERNNNFPVVGTDVSVGGECTCVSSPEVLCDTVNYGAVFDFSSKFFCKDSCTVGEKICADVSSYKTCGLNGYSCLNFESTTSCPVATPFCIGAGQCEECATNCDNQDILINDFRCNGDSIEQKYWNYSCVSNSCEYVEEWVDSGTDCLAPNVCYNPTARDDCCAPVCPGGAECGDDECGGDCPPGCTAPDICATDGSKQCVSSGNAYWANMNGEIIFGDGKAQIGDTVLLIYKDKGRADYSFQIYEEDPGEDEFVVTIDKANNFDYNGHLAATWEIPSGWEDGLDDKAEFYFDVDIETSDYLNIDGTIDANSNSKPSVRIIKPVVRSNVMVGTDLSFEQIARDEDDDLQIKWIFEDGDESDWVDNCLTGSDCNITHAYDSSGTKIIGVIAREMTRTQEAVNNSQVFVYAEGINVFADILTPPFGKIYINEDAGGSAARLIPFSANTTYIANCENDENDCNVYAERYEGAAASYCFDVSGNNALWCYDIPRLNDNKAIGEYELIMDWEFSENVGRSGTWTGETGDDYDEVVEFQRMFFAPITHWARLSVDYIDLT